MAKRRMIDTRFWNDSFIIDLQRDEKLLFLYCLTNQYTDICGVYECPMKVIAFETGIGVEELQAIFDKFAGKVHYIEGWIYVRNFAKYQSENDSIRRGMQKGLANVPQNIRDEIDRINKQYSKTVVNTLFGQVDPKQEAQDLKDAKRATIDQALEKDIDALIGAYKEKIAAGARITDKARAKIRKRLTEFTLDELLKAITLFSKDKWRMQHNSMNGLQWFFNSEDQIAKWLGLQSEVESQSRKSIKV